MDPTTPVTRPDGAYAYTNYIDSDIVNPINQIDQTHDNWTTNRFVGNVFGEVDVFRELKFRSSVNVDLRWDLSKSSTPRTIWPCSQETPTDLRPKCETSTR